MFYGVIYSFLEEIYSLEYVSLTKKQTHTRTPRQCTICDVFVLDIDAKNSYTHKQINVYSCHIHLKFYSHR